jgi:hypothetical protein
MSSIPGQTQPFNCFPDPRLDPTRPDIICIMAETKPAVWPLPCKCINKGIPEHLTLTAVISFTGGVPPFTAQVTLVVNGAEVTTVSRQSSGEPVRIPFQGIASRLQAGGNTIEARVTVRDALGRTVSGSSATRLYMSTPPPLQVQVGVEL